jgi:uncharacterized protein YndB with AHSA1/START domain
MTVSSGSAKVTTPAEDEILVTRELDAPRRLVYRAWTTPELVRRWWAGRRGELQVVEIDLRVDGSWRYVMTTNDGMEIGFHGEFRELVPDERIVYTEAFEQAPPGAPPVLNTLTLEEEGGRTRLTLLTQCGSREVRDVILQSGMEVGLQEQMDLLEELAAAEA